MSKRFWIITIAIQSSVIVIVAFMANSILVGAEILFVTALADVLTELLVFARKQWRKFAGIEDLDRKEQS